MLRAVALILKTVMLDQAQSTTCCTLHTVIHGKIECIPATLIWMFAACFMVAQEYVSMALWPSEDL